jgi:hypothetical protein
MPFDKEKNVGVQVGGPDRSEKDTLTSESYAHWLRQTQAYDTEVWYDKYLDYFDDCYDAAAAIVKAPKFRRLALYILSITVVGLFLWSKLIWPWIEEERAAWHTFQTYAENATEPLYGSNVRPHLGGIIQSQELDSAYLPGGPKAKKRRRLVFIGDIHGCKKELLQLLAKLDFNEAQDHIIAVGDIIDKGPDSLGVIDFLMQKKASVVRGNHEDRVILLAEKHNRNAHEATEDASATKKKSHHDRSPEGVAKALSRKQLDFLKSFPVILKIGPVKKIGEIVTVHGGLVPGVPLEAQDPVSIMNMRSIDLKTHVPSKQHSHKHKRTRPWYRIWNKYQRLLPAMEKWRTMKKWKHGLMTQQLTVVYGHDARTGLQISRFSKGLDTNCSRGGKLTALVVDERGHQSIVQVDCHKNYTKSDEE